MPRKLNHVENYIKTSEKKHMAGALLMMLGRLFFNFMNELILPGTNITIELEKTDHTDLYGRALAYVYLPGGRCLNEMMIAEDYAKHYSRYYCQEQANYQQLNSRAKNERKGLCGGTVNF